MRKVFLVACLLLSACLLIMPQVHGTNGYNEPDPLQVPTMAEIDRRVRQRWPADAPSAFQAAESVKVLSDDSCAMMVCIEMPRVKQSRLGTCLPG